MIQFDITFDTSGLDEQLNDLTSGGDIEATVYNTAQSEEGTYYFEIVNNGRGEVFPVRAKALHWVDRDGRDVFAMHSGPAAPRHMRERAAPVIQQGAERMATSWQHGGDLSRDGIAEFVNQVAEKVAVPALQAVTPVVTGKLQQSYEVEKAE